jgi:hypothetical protein
VLHFIALFVNLFITTHDRLLYKSRIVFLNCSLDTSFIHSNPTRAGVGLSICLELEIGRSRNLKLSRTLPVASELELKIPF